MKLHYFKSIAILLAIFFSGLQFNLSTAQDISPWIDNPKGNEWISDHSKKYVRITVAKDGMFKISKATLDANFPGIPLAQLQLFRRGREVAMGETQDNGVIFYGLKNDGASDGLMYRPGPEARMNPYVSHYSTLGYYFLTTSTGNTKRFDPEIDGTDFAGLTAEAYHIQKRIATYRTRFSHHSYGVESSNNNSYFSNLNTWASESHGGASATLISYVKSRFLNVTDFKMPNWVNTSDLLPNLEILVSGMAEGSHEIKVAAGKTSTTLSQVVAFERFTGYGVRKKSLDLPASVFNSDGSGYMQLTSTTTESLDWFALGYYTLTFPQKTDMRVEGVTLASSQFNFKKSATAPARVKILNAPSDPLLFDITDLNSPKPLKGVKSGADLDVKISLQGSTEFRLLAVSQASGITLIANADITPVNFKPMHANSNGDETKFDFTDPAKYDYLIITHSINKSTQAYDNQFVESAKDYGKYRASSDGGSYNTLVVDIRDLYDQFNFGEPSPLAIRRFVNYMLDGKKAREKHNLLLLGHGVAHPMNIALELKGEVPTYGDPGSDVLLVSGLSGSDIDVQSIPVGRVSAFNHAEVASYLNKVKEYEDYNSGENLDWRTQILNLNGAKTQSESQSFNNYFDFVRDNYVPSSDRSKIEFRGTQGPAFATNSSPNIKTVVDNGVGLISYFGHGSRSDMRVNVGKVSAPGAYSATKKYSLFYLNGCESSDVFFTRDDHYFTADWLLTPDKGSVAVVSTSYLAWYPDATRYHMYPFYQSLFNFTNGGKSVGQILKSVSEGMVGSGSGRVLASDRTKMHVNQLILQGDPALILLKTTAQLPVDLISFKAAVKEDNTIQLTWKTTWESNNSHFIVEHSKDAKKFESIGSVDGKGNSDVEATYNFLDANPFPGINYYRLVQVDGTAQTSTDGKKTISRIVKAEISDNNLVNVFPNPIRDKVEVKLNASLNLKSWNLINNKGIVVKNGSTTIMNVNNLPIGIYVLEVTTSEGATYRKKLVKE